MKRLVSLLLAVIMVLGASTTALAADYSLNDRQSPLLSGDSRVITRTVKTKSSSVTVEALYYPEISKDILTQTNVEREKVGAGKLAWDSNLEGPALQRAAEIVLNWSHTRPDGTMPNALSPYLRGENLLRGNACTDAYEAVSGPDGWITSKGHYDNMVDKDYTTMAAAVIERNGTAYWVQVFGDGKSTGSAASGTTSTASSPSTATAKTPAAAASSAGASGNVGADGAVSAAKIKAEVESAVASATGASAEVRTKNAQSIAPATLQTMANAAGSKAVVLNADTMSADGKAVQGRLYVEPAKLKELATDLKLGVYTDNAKTSATKTKFEKYYDNKVVVVRMEQNGSMGARLKVAAKVDLSGLNTENLCLYACNRSDNTYVTVAEPAYSIDKDGYIYFYTSNGGDIIITDKALTVK